MGGFGFGPVRAARRRLLGGASTPTPTPTPPTPTPTPTPPTPTPTPSPPALLAHGEPFTAAGNSFLAQSGNIDILQWMWMGMGCRGLPTAGMRQALGGERIDHLVGRAAPINALRPGFVDVMNIENDLGQVTNDAAGGEAVFANLQAFIAAIRAVRSDSRFLVARQANTNARTNKPLAAARYDTLVAALAASDTKVHVHDEGSAFDAASSAQTTDGTHPNKRVSARALGLGKGAIAASLYDPADIFDGGLQLPIAINRTENAGSTVFNAATAWTTNTNSSGLSVSQASGFLAERPSVPARVFTFSGTCGADETLSTAVPDAVSTLNLFLPTGHSTHGRNYTAVLLIEITNAAGDGPPVNLASLQLNLGSAAQAFSKIVIAAQEPYWIDAYKGPIGLIPFAPATAQVGFFAFSFTMRGRNGLPIDAQVRIAALNLIETEAAAYGAPAFTSKIYNSGRPAMNYTPSQSGSGTYTVGTAININQAGTCLGGGLTRTYEVIRTEGGVETVVGTCSPALNGVAASPYLVQAADVGSGKTLKVRSHASNGFGADFMDTPARASA